MVTRVSQAAASDYKLLTESEELDLLCIVSYIGPQ